MRIGIYDPYLDDLGGGEKYMMSIASYLSKKNEITVFWDNKQDLNSISERFNLDLSKINLFKNIFSTNISIFQRILETRKFDVLIILSDGSIPLVLSKKLFLHIQQPLDYIATSSTLDKFKLSRVNGIFVNSVFTKSFLEKKINKKIEVIYPPVEVSAKKVKKENIILHVGRFRAANMKNSDYKKQSFMIDTFKKMVDSGLKNWKFIMAAGVLDKDKEEFEKMRESAKNYPIEFFINQTNEKIWDLYSKAKIYWHASGFGEDLEEYPEYAEHFGISTVEAMGVGCVPVVINAGGQPEIVTNAEDGFLWNTSQEFIGSTEKLIKDNKLWLKLSENAQIRAKDFSKEKFEGRINKLIA